MSNGIKYHNVHTRKSIWNSVYHVYRRDFLHKNHDIDCAGMWELVVPFLLFSRILHVYIRQMTTSFTYYYTTATTIDIDFVVVGWSQKVSRKFKKNEMVYITKHVMQCIPGNDMQKHPSYLYRIHEYRDTCNKNIKQPGMTYKIPCYVKLLCEDHDTCNIMPSNNLRDICTFYLQ